MKGEFLRFVLVGGLGFIVDAGCTWLLVRGGVSPIGARVPALLLAMLVTWLLNRSLTFRVERPKSRAELARYASVALSSAALNFALYTALVVAGLPAVAAVAAATIALMLFSFFAYRHAVFR